MSNGAPSCIVWMVRRPRFVVTCESVMCPDESWPFEITGSVTTFESLHCNDETYDGYMNRKRVDYYYSVLMITSKCAISVFTMKVLAGIYDVAHKPAGVMGNGN